MDEQRGRRHPSSQPAVGDRIAHYRVLKKLGEGGMGAVFEAEDERLGRRVALKLLSDTTTDPQAHARLVREARVAAGVSHPLICQVFELGEWRDRPFIAMELAEGESLADRLARGPLTPVDALRVAASVADALSVLHRHGIVHRDLKPSNIFVGRAGIKVLDFGLARAAHGMDGETRVTLTQIGMFVGTPQYASPEQLAGETIDHRTDLFAAGAILFEMLAGRPPFGGATLAALAHAVLYDTPPVLTGSASIAMVDRIVHRALSKHPSERYDSAAALAEEVRAALALSDGGALAEARPILRLAVVPFRTLKPDPDFDYLGRSLADALTASLSGLESLVLRSSIKAARYAQGIPDLNVLASDLAVDVVLTGSVLVQGGIVRVSAELVSVPAGDVWWSQTTQTSVDGVLDWHDELARQVIAALPLSSRDRAEPRPARPASPKAFDLYLRGLNLRGEPSGWRQAHAFFAESLQIDPTFAAAWAERGRLERVLGKYEDPALLTQAEAALGRAIELDPDLGAAQYYYAQLEIDLGRIEGAFARLLERVRRRRAEPHVYAALVHACRYAGLLDESIAAHRQAHRLDPSVGTSVLHTHYMRGDYDRALEEGHRSSDPFEARVLGAMRRDREAVQAARKEEARFASVPLLRAFCASLRAAFEGQTDEAVAALVPFHTFQFTDGEGLFYVAQIFAKVDHRDQALAVLTRSMEAGFVCLSAFERDPYLEGLHDMAEWPALMERIRRRQQIVADAFSAADGWRLLSMPQPRA